LRDVENISAQIAQKYKNEEYAIPLSRLSDIETKGVLPSIYRVYSLAVIYRLDYTEILSWYGIEMARVAGDHGLAEPRETHRSNLLKASSVNIPVKLDPSFNLRATSNLGRLIEKWGAVPFSYVEELANSDFTYGYIGTEDFTMYPLVMPGSFIQVDENKDEVAEGLWRSEYERPIYFVETREGHICSWCSIRGDHIILQPHPLSPVPVRIMRHPQEAEVVGQVVGVAMKLDQFSTPTRPPDAKVPAKLN
jgi:hypothetical protein